MKSNCAAVKKMIRDHINDYYTPEELKNQVYALIDHNRIFTVYHALRYMVEGGCFLVYNYQIKQFLNGLGINPEGKEYDTQKSFDLYCHLIARDGELLVKKA